MLHGSEGIGLGRRVVGDLLFHPVLLVLGVLLRLDALLPRRLVLGAPPVRPREQRPEPAPDGQLLGGDAGELADLRRDVEPDGLVPQQLLDGLLAAVEARHPQRRGAVRVGLVQLHPPHFGQNLEALG